MRTHLDVSARLGGALLLVASATSVFAQVPNANPAATGVSGAFTARARGYDAVAWNPANLGLPGNPSFSLGVLALTGSSGLDPISLNDFAPYSSKVLPSAQREQWLQTVTAKGGENGRLDGGVTFLGLSAGPIAIQVSSSVGGSTKLNPDAVQAILFGNAGRTGSVANLNFAGSSLDVAGFTTGALSYGLSLGSHLALGVTGKYIVGNFVAMAQDQGSASTADALSVSFPMVYSSPDSNMIVGSGAGVDLGLAWSSRRLAVGATVQNVVNTFAWDQTKLLSKAGTALFNAGGDTTDFADRPYSDAPDALRAKIANDKFKPTVAMGFAYTVGPSLVLSADARQQMGDGIAFGPKTQIGGGAELRALSVLRLRGGASYVTNGWGVSGGAGLAFGAYELGIGAALRTINGGKEPAITVNVLSIR